MTDYQHFHKDRVNLAIHVAMVPLFVAGVIGAAWNAASGRPIGAAASALLPLLSLAAQGFGHKREPNPPLPFKGPGNFVKRILVEQFWRFPSFVLTGGWARAWRQGGRKD